MNVKNLIPHSHLSNIGHALLKRGSGLTGKYTNRFCGRTTDYSTTPLAVTIPPETTSSDCATRICKSSKPCTFYHTLFSVKKLNELDDTKDRLSDIGTTKACKEQHLLC